MARNYSAYLEMYGHAYGDMSDPVKRAETIAMLRRRDARALAAARREIRAEYGRRSTGALKSKAYEYWTCLNSERISQYRYKYAPHIRAVDLHNFRMILNELERRGVAL
jgi:hypothetical protein